MLGQWDYPTFEWIVLDNGSTNLETVAYLQGLARHPQVKIFRVEANLGIVGAVRGTFGLVAVFLGVAAGGYLTLRLGNMRALYIGGTLQIVGTIAYAILPFVHDELTFAAVMAILLTRFISKGVLMGAVKG